MTSVPFTLGRRVPARHLLLRLEAAGLAAHRDHQEQLRDRGAHRAPPLARHGRGARRTWLGLGSGLGLGLGLTRWLSCTTQAGLEPFLAALSDLVRSRYGATDGEAALITRARHREHG